MDMIFKDDFIEIVSLSCDIKKDVIEEQLRDLEC